MINKIVNWTLGGFFRTLGKFLLFLIVSLLLGYFISKSDIKVLDWLGIGYVNASTVSYTNGKSTKEIININDGTIQWTAWQDFGYQYYPPSNYWVKSFASQFTNTSGFTSGTAYTIKLSVNTTPKSPFNYTSLECNGSVNTNASWSTSLISSCNLINVEQGTGNNFIYYYITLVPASTIKQIAVKLDSTNGEYYSRFNVDTSTTITNDTSTQDAINSQTIILSGNINQQTQVIQQGMQSINDKLTNTNTLQESSDASDFFHNFNLSIEGPASQIVLLPINLINSILDGSSTSDLCFTLNGTQVCFPNGSILWSRSGCHDNGAWFGCPNFTAFRTFFALVGEGFIIIYLLKKIVKTTEKALDPSKSEVEVMNL